MIYFLTVLCGALGWTLTEYWLHRSWGHRGEAKNPFSLEHLAHHADLSYFAPTYKKAIAGVFVAATSGPILFLIFGPPGIAAALGFTSMYIIYEVIHRRLHTHPGRSRYGRWVRRHHLHHHYRRPKSNHGVTSPLWDIVFCTLDVPEIVKVPRKKALHWMLDPDRELRSELADDFVLIGRKKGGRG